MFPTHYTFCLCVPKGLVVDKRSLRIEVHTVLITFISSIYAGFPVTILRKPI